VAENTGDVTLTEVTISEVDFSGAGELSELTCDPAQPATLAPGEVLECEATYEVEQADIDAGEVTNSAEVTGTDPNNDEVADEDDEVVTADQQPGLVLDKSAEPSEELVLG